MDLQFSVSYATWVLDERFWVEFDSLAFRFQASDEPNFSMSSDHFWKRQKKSEKPTPATNKPTTWAFTLSISYLRAWQTSKSGVTEDHSLCQVTLLPFFRDLSFIYAIFSTACDEAVTWMVNNGKTLISGTNYSICETSSTGCPGTV